VLVGRQAIRLACAAHGFAPLLLGRSGLLAHRGAGTFGEAGDRACGLPRVRVRQRQSQGAGGCLNGRRPWHRFCRWVAARGHRRTRRGLPHRVPGHGNACSGRPRLAIRRAKGLCRIAQSRKDREQRDGHGSTVSPALVNRPSIEHRHDGRGQRDGGTRSCDSGLRRCAPVGLWIHSCSATAAGSGGTGLSCWLTTRAISASRRRSPIRHHLRVAFPETRASFGAALASRPISAHSVQAHGRCGVAAVCPRFSTELCTFSVGKCLRRPTRAARPDGRRYAAKQSAAAMSAPAENVRTTGVQWP
jgi:hypothetical protein